MSSHFGYIYIRNNISYDIYNACKLGKTNNIPERDSQYATGEIKRGFFEVIFEVSIKEVGYIERLLQYEFRNYNIKYDAGIEFYDRCIITLIEEYLINIGIKYNKLCIKDISNLLRCNRIKNITNKINIKKLITILQSKNNYKPRDYQNDIIKNSILHFTNNNKGLLVLTCGVGKTLISLWITKQLQSCSILIGVPNLLLLLQWEEKFKIIFKNTPYLIVSNGIKQKKIINFLNKYDKNCIIITTYASSYKVYEATNKINFIFDMKINDEVHHLSSFNINLNENTKKFSNMIKISSNKQLSLTATVKILENQENKKDDEIILSNDNIEYFGEIIEKKCLLWAITKNIVCDYVIQTIITNEEQLEEHLKIFNIIEDNDKRLFLSAFVSLKSIFEGHSHHLLIYSNNKENSLKIKQYINKLLDNKYFDIPELYYSNYNSDIKTIQQKDIINNFSKSKYGIITCVYCLSEGWDLPLLDGEVFAENMSSIIRIYQSSLRGGRKNILEPNKINKIILPILNRNNLLENNDNIDLKKVREIIYQMGLEDETIIQKIKVCKINIEKYEKYEKKQDKNIDEFGEYDNELTQLIRLKTIKRAALSTTYEKAKKIIANKNIKNKNNYYELCNIDNRLTKEPDIVFIGQFTNWIDYLNIERIYYDLETCINKVNNYILLYPEILNYYFDLSIITNKLCEIDKLFPPNDLWIEYYNIKDLRNIIKITNNKKIFNNVI